MDQVIQSLLDGNHIEVWSVTISRVAFWLGLVFVVLGVVKMTQEQRYQGRQSSMITAGTLSVLSGIVLMSLEAFIVSLTESVFNVASTNDFKMSGPFIDITDTFVPATGAGPEVIYIEFAVYIIQIVGLLAIIRGVVLYRTAHVNSQHAFAGAWHLIGGIIGLNFVTFMDFVGQSGGPGVSSVIGRLFG